MTWTTTPPTSATPFRPRRECPVDRASPTVSRRTDRPLQAFQLYVNRPGRTHPGTGQSGQPARIIYEPFDGGRWYEIGADGTEYEWGRVLTWDPPRRLTLAWMVSAATGEWTYDPDPLHASLAEITFDLAPEGTLVTVTHTGFERHGPTGPRIREGVAIGWSEDLADLYRAVAQHSAGALETDTGNAIDAIAHAADVSEPEAGDLRSHPNLDGRHP